MLLLWPNARLTVTTGQWVGLAVIAIVAGASFSALLVAPPRRWQVDALQTDAMALIMTLLVGWLAAVLTRQATLTLHLSLALLSTQLWLTLAAGLFLFDFSATLGPWWWTAMNAWWWVLGAWAVVPIVRVLRGVRGHFEWKQGPMAVLLTAILMTPVHFLFGQQHFVTDWRQDGLTPTTTLDAEALLSRQSSMVASRLQAVAPGRADSVDIFALTFAAYGSQDLFANEVRLLEQRLREQFDVDPAHIVSLINHPYSLADTPLATRTNLAQALLGLGDQADANDVLVVYIASHGSADPSIYVELDALPLNPLQPSFLAQALADSGFKWKVVIVSACYAGGFVPPLADENTIVITAAAADRTSFGCTDDAELSYFGQAFVDQALAETGSLSEAFALARIRVTERELQEGFEPSNPQMHVGAKIHAFLTDHTPLKP